MLKLEDLDLDMIASAMQDDGSMGAEYYLDLDTGDVVLPGFSDDLEIQDIQEGNYAWIDRIESYESYRHMEDFTHALPEGQARMKLEQALIRSYRGSRPRLRKRKPSGVVASLPRNPKYGFAAR